MEQGGWIVTKITPQENYFLKITPQENYPTGKLLPENYFLKITS